MTEAERASALADEIDRGMRREPRVDDEVIPIFGDWEDCSIIVAALRAYYAPASTDAELREAVARAIWTDGDMRGDEDSYDLSVNDLWRSHPVFRYADAALSAIHASGWRIVPAGYTDRIVAEARRYASHYPIGSDGRNTFEMFADFVVRLTAKMPAPSADRPDTNHLRETF